MPIHDWTRVNSGLFHEFHQSWSVRIKDSLNGQLPKGYCALVEQRVDGPEPDVIAVETKLKKHPKAGGTTVLEPPQTKLISRIPTDAELYSRKANRIAIHHSLGDVVAIIEIVSPGNKDTRHAIRNFAEKSAAFLRAGVHVLVIDLFPPSKRDPQGIHKVIADEFHEEIFESPEGKPLTLVSYQAGEELTAYIEPVAVGDAMPDMPLYIARDWYLHVPIESTYQATWTMTPEPIRELLEPAP
jgi:Protein of unknown function (DUF4058)